MKERNILISVERLDKNGHTQKETISTREFYKQNPWLGMDTPEAIAEHHRAHGMNEYADAFMELVRYEDELSRRVSAGDGIDIR